MDGEYDSDSTQISLDPNTSIAQLMARVYIYIIIIY